MCIKKRQQKRPGGRVLLMSPCTSAYGLPLLKCYPSLFVVYCFLRLFLLHREREREMMRRRGGVGEEEERGFIKTKCLITLPWFLHSNI